MEVGDPAHERDLSALPPLSVLAAVAAVLHLSVYRVLLPVLASQKKPLPELLLTFVPLALNVAVCAGLVGFGTSSWQVLRTPRVAHVSRRVLVAALSVLILYMVGMATFSPSARMDAHQVFLATGAVHTMAVQLAVAAMAAQRSVSGRITAGLIAAASAFPLGTLLLRQWDPTGSFAGGKGLASLHALGELSYLLAPITAAFVVVPWSESNEARRARTVGAVAAGLMMVLFGFATLLPHAMYGHILYSSLRLEWALERASLGYAVPVSLAIGAAVAASVSRHSNSRQGGVGLCLFLAAGYSPLTPARLLLAALGASLICRALFSAADHDEAQRRV